ncbi:nucleotidyl transferase AbiEii/AbiGii toxin family protein [Taklimakanibacter lacteus]|uniref:nucleotidyl transferase AbiEii/AbiGii toxin family protein n=1 Tax=Taklimakanibacter lacteus TaxID=2268456 RepID=UPI000E66518D
MPETLPGSRKWLTSDWRNLLREAIALIDTLDDNPAWTFGGGTSLAVHYDHRISYDIDIFVPSAQVLTDLSPNRNPTTKGLLSGRSYQFTGNYLKLELDGGEIDFIIGANRTGDPTRRWRFEGRDIPIDTPWETATKKMFYRPSTFKIRDVFDLAAVIDRDGEKLKPSLPEIEDRLDKLIDRVDALAPTYERVAIEDINPTETGRKYIETAAVYSVMNFLSGWRSAS